MRCSVLVLCLLSAASGCSRAVSRDAASTGVELLSSAGRLESLPLLEIAHRELPPWRDMALDPLGDLLILGRDGELYFLRRDDELALRPFGADLEAGIWPEAVAADAMDWLLLVDRGRALLRLGRRGESLGRTDLPEPDILWRGLQVDRSGRIWLSERNEGKLALVSRGGQRLQLWDLEIRVPGYVGPLLAWCPDEAGGLYLLEGWTPVCHHLNAAGNPLLSWPVQLPAGDAALAVDDRERLLITVGPESEGARLFHRKLWDEYYVAQGSSLRILEIPRKDP